MCTRKGVTSKVDGVRAGQCAAVCMAAVDALPAAGSMCRMDWKRLCINMQKKEWRNE